MRPWWCVTDLCGSHGCSRVPCEVAVDCLRMAPLGLVTVTLAMPW